MEHDLKFNYTISGFILKVNDDGSYRVSADVICNGKKEDGYDFFPMHGNEKYRLRDKILTEIINNDPTDQCIIGKALIKK